MGSPSLLRLAAGIVLAAGPSFRPALAGAPEIAASSPATRLVVTNPLDRVRAGETIAVGASTAPGLRSPDLAKVAVVDEATRKPVLSQAVDYDGDGAADQLVFQADLGPREARTFLLLPGERAPYRREDFRVYGRFVRERHDDFAWENDRVAHRMYGPALEAWQEEPLTSSTVDVWCKKTPRLVVNDWYLVDDYHRDHGEGADLYSAGKSRGMGGTGVVRDSRLYTSRNFRESRVLAAGPIRLVFELTYAPWNAGGVTVSERKRVTLDAGSRFNRFESRWTVEGDGAASFAAGLRKAPGAAVRIDKGRGVLRTWEALKEGNGNLGLALLVEPSSLTEVLELDGNVLAVGKPLTGAPTVHWAGSAWDRSGDVPTMEAWDRAISEFLERRRAPLKIDILVP